MENLFNFCFDEYTYPNPAPIQPAGHIEVSEPSHEGVKDGKKSHYCTFPGCGKIFRFKSELGRHSVVHDIQRSFNCTYAGCFKTFKREDALKNHLRIHTGEMPFVCSAEGCEERFPTKAGLRYHMLKHNGEKVFVCSYAGCNKSFFTQAQLRQHENSINYHKKMAWQIPENQHAPISVTKVEKKREVPQESLLVSNPTKGKEDIYDDEFFSSNLTSSKGIEWGMQDQLEDAPTEDDQDLQQSFEQMIKIILKDNNEMKKKLNMSSTLKGLMEENFALKQKLGKASNQEYEEVPSLPQISDEKIFSFLNFS